MDLGVIGMAVMGRNIAMNGAQKGLKVAIFNRTAVRTDKAVIEAEKQGLILYPFNELKEFVGSLARPRKILIMVQAGGAVDSTIELLMALLESGDILIDGGNEFWGNTDRRIEAIKKVLPGLHYMAMGVSGGEEGARHGPSLMPGGNEAAYREMKPIFDRIAARGMHGSICSEYMGKGSAGNYVKMVHNGIEYGDMQLIAETYDLMRKVNKYSNEKIGEIFGQWNSDGNVLKSYLIEITSHIFLKKDDREGEEGFLVDKVLDVAGSKGTGKWTVQEAAENGVPCPTIAAALESRYLSVFREARVKAHELFGEEMKHQPPNDELNATDLENALFCAKICSYAQGMQLLKTASVGHGYDIDLSKVAKIWTGGCIIRADFLDNISKAFERRADLDNLLFDKWFAEHVKTKIEGLRRVVVIAQTHGVPVPALAGSLNYFDALRARSLPLNLLQSQRDYFGAHTYIRRDFEEIGPIHSQWNSI